MSLLIYKLTKNVESCTTCNGTGEICKKIGERGNGPIYGFIKCSCKKALEIVIKWEFVYSV